MGQKVWLNVRPSQKVLQMLVCLILLALPLGIAVLGYGQDNTTISVSCTSPVFVNEGSTCTATVSNSDTTADPTGTVDFTITTGSGAFSPSASCTLDVGTANDGQSSCSVTYTPDSATPSTHEIDASYTPDSASFNASSTTTPASITVNLRTTSTTVSCSPDPAAIGGTTTCTVTVSDTATGTASTPTGTVSFDDGGKAGSFSSDTCTLDASGSCSVDYTPGKGDAGTTTITATYGGDSVHDTSSGTYDLTVVERETKTEVLQCTTPLFVGETGTCEIKVTDVATQGTPSNPEGTITLTDSTGNGTFGPCVLSYLGTDAATCTAEFTPTAPGTHTITAAYTPQGDSIGLHAASLDSTGKDVIVNPRTTATTVVCSETPLVVNEPTLCTVTVSDIAPGAASVPTGTVTFSVSPSSEGGVAPTSCVLDAAGQCSVTYTPSKGDTAVHTITANYGGDGTHALSSGSFDQAIQKRAADVLLSCSPTTVYIDQTLTCTVTVVDDTTTGVPSVPTGTVSFDDGGKAGSFSSDTCTLTAGVCTVDYTPAPGDAGSTTLTAAYNGSSVHSVNSRSQQIVVNLRPTIVEISCESEAGVVESVYVNETATCTVTIRDIGPDPKSAPEGTVNLSTSASGNYTIGSCSSPSVTSDSYTCSFTYKRTALPDFDAGFDILTVSYQGSTRHAAGEAGFALGIMRRKTETTVSCQDQTSPSTCTVEVKEDSSNRGTSSTPQGTVVAVSDINSTEGYSAGDTLCTLDSSGKCTFPVSPKALKVNITVRYEPNDDVHLKSIGAFNLTAPDSSLPTDPTGAKDIATILHDQLKSCWDAESAALGLSGLQIFTDQIPDEVVVALFGGVTIPVSDLAAAVLGLAALALESYAQAACKDIDGDGLPVSVEDVIGTNDNNWDSDGDGLGDPDEIFSAGGFYGGDPPACPSPTDADSDDDGLDDGQEDMDIGTDFCNPDTDGDGAGTASTSDYYEVNVSGTNPLDPDTDDGLCDANGTGSGCPAPIRSEASAGTDSLNPDTDGDEILDGAEDLDGDGVFGITDGEPDPTLFDTDSDGLSDGFELGSGSGCDPAIDDTDGDGLSDSEEVNVTHTTCSRADSDSDGLSDADEVIVLSGAFPNRVLQQVSDPLSPDTDGDGLSDSVEYGGSGVTRTTVGPGGTPDSCGVMSDQDGFVNNPDSDNDGLNDGADALPEVPAASGNGGELNDDAVRSICDPDSDGDGLLDGVEATQGTDPLDWDSDDDGLSDREELQTYFTDPNNADTDGDGADGQIATRNAAIAPTLAGYAGPDTIDCKSDCEEALSLSTQGNFIGDPLDQTDPLKADTDGDGLLDSVEFTPGCSSGNDGYANSFDSDGDGASDGAEFSVMPPGDVAASWGNDGELNDDTLASICDPDSDGDGLLDGAEIAQGTAPNDWDTDDDGLSDREELQIYFTNPLNPDTDGDTADGNIPARDATLAPVLSGHSGNGTIDCKSDCEEALSASTQGAFTGNPLDQTDPLQIDTDGDGINDNIEFPVGCVGGMTGFANSFDSDGDGLRDLEDAVDDIPAASVNHLAITPDPSNAGELNDDALDGICDPDSDGDGLLDGEEHQIGTDPNDWDTDNDGRSDAEVLGSGPIPTDPLDFDTDDDGIGDGVEVFGANPTNPVNADTDGDGLCDGGGHTPSGTGTNPLCFGGTGSVGGIGDHPNPNGYGEDENGNGQIDPGETDPNQFDTDGDGEGDGVEKLGFSTSRQGMIPATDLFGRPITVVYPSPGCMDPLDPDTDDDGLLDGFEDFNHDGNFDFLPSDFDHADPLPGPVRPEPEETNPCDPDTDHDGLNDYQERNQPNPPTAFPFNPTNPLDHDTDNDWLLDGEEVAYTCTPATVTNLDNDGDGLIDEDPLDGLDNDDDGLIDEDGPDFTVISVDVLDPTNRDSDSDGIIDGLDPDPCNSPPIPIVSSVTAPREEPVDTDGDGFADEDEQAAGTDPNDPDSHPTAFAADLDQDGVEDDRLWLEDPDEDGIADAVALDLNADGQVDARIEIIPPRDFAQGDFDEDGVADDCRYVIVYALSNYRALQPRIVLTIYDYNCDLVIDKIKVERR
jgi:hypothetical protein